MTGLARLERLDAAMLAEVRDDWLAVGLATGPGDEAAAVDGVRAAYAEVGLRPPRIAVWLDSPLAGCIGSWMLGQVWGQVRDQVWDQVGDQVGDQVRAAIYGQHDAGWLGFCGFFAAAAPRVRGPERLAGLMQVARNAGWWWPFEGAVVLTRRPTALHRDERGRLHNPTGPAVMYGDGFAVHAWHGQRMPAEVMEAHAADRLTVDMVQGLGNEEQRRCAIEMLGHGRYVRESGARVVHADDWGTLYDIGGVDPPVRVVHCVNSSRHADGNDAQYWIPVDPDDPRCQTACGALAWTFDEDVDAYRAMTVQA